MKYILATTAVIVSTSFASAGCKQNFNVLGVPLLTEMQYRTEETYQGVSKTTAAKRLAERLKAEGYIRVKRSGGVVTAFQETSGSGRPQELRFIVSENAGKTRIEAIFTVQQGQVAPERAARDELCRLISTVAG